MFPREFPIGLYGVPSPSDIPEIAAAGFSHILPASDELVEQKALAKAAATASIAFVAIPPSPPTSDYMAAIRPVSAWYLSDEPDVNHVSPGDIQRQAEEIRRRAPASKIVLVVGNGIRAADFSKSVDAVLVDWYPVPHLPLSSLGDQITSARLSGPGKPIIAVLQAMDWRDYQQRDPHKPRVGRFPTLLEMRFMAYQAIVRGAAGVYFFEFRKRSTPGKTLLDSPEQWQALRRISLELRTLKSFLESGEGEPLKLEGLEGMRWLRSRREIVVLVNPGPGPQRLPERFLGPRFKAVFENRINPREALPAGLLDANRAIVLVGG